MNFSNIPSAQPWLEQFDKEDRNTAIRLLDQLIYVKSEDVLGALKEKVEQLIADNIKVALFPIREFVGGEGDDSSSSYFSLTDDSIAPILQSAQAPLGSEANASNLITQVSRLYKRKVISTEACNKDPSLENLRDGKVKKLILIDDLIGSGKRTTDFLSAFYRHPTIKSWVSSKHISIDVICYMATPNGQNVVSKWCRKRANINLHVLRRCPMINQNDTDIIDLCNDYASKNERYPIGFGDCPVRVVFSHSAPNNLPALLYRDAHNYKPKALRLRNRSDKWAALFPKRALPEIVKLELDDLKVSKPNKTVMLELLLALDTDPNLPTDLLSDCVASNSSQLALCKSRCLKNNWIYEDKGLLNITEAGKKELLHLRRDKNRKSIAINTASYYPSTMSRAMRHQD